MKKTHLDNLVSIINIPDLAKILDIGSGKGTFLIDASKRGFNVYGIEVFDEYINISFQKAKEENTKINVTKGVGENLPFENNIFDFINLSEVIEHVENPDKLLSEIKRVLRPKGKVYISVPSRFSWLDTHYHIWFLNWMPRYWSHKLIGILGKHKDYSGNNGKQRIDEMFYSTYSSFVKKIILKGLIVKDIREIKIRKEFPNKIIRFFALMFYRIIRPFYFKTFHFLLEKE